MTKPKILFICTANAARSQMAEGLLRTRYGDRYEVYSAGTRQSKVSVRAVAVMQEIGIDISHHYSKTVDDVAGISFDLAITLCDNAHAICPVVRNAKKTIHQGFDDPHLVPGTDEEILNGYRRVRDEIAAWIDTTFGTPGTREFPVHP
ncbi:arsenate reductase ArsC [Methanoregula sp.]|uniref:arsenate reductase ArsC n=1 Tax=Methanoregula sp. TaxID=2052170 RepID=UPI00237284DF|nr:arsenate reductase ArsC [Methanoregula sp.]MDD1687346.1 arsenate reductase ArsC [Methanoregula sp.]